MNASEHFLEIGTVLRGKWVILEFIGKGGMGEVYRAHQVNLKRDVAIKIISREWLDSCEQEEEFKAALQRFRNEVQAMAQVRHPNVLQIYDYDSCPLTIKERDLPVEYLAMEFIPGGTLWSTMSEDGFYPEEELTREWISTYFLPVLDGVQALHESNIIHRDLKPGNVFMDGKIPKIADFGLARSCRLQPVTRSVDVHGTPQYMPPEQFIDLKRTDNRADIYAMGKILCEAISGKMDPKTIPFKKASLKDPQTAFFKGLDQIIQKATAESREDRYESAAKLRSAIDSAITPSRAKGKADALLSAPAKKLPIGTRRNWIFGGIAFLVLLGISTGLWQWVKSPEKSDSPGSIIASPPVGEIASHTKPPPSSLAPILESQDSVNLLLIPGGEISSGGAPGEGSSKTTKVNSFYMDETQVTNHQYVDFLNKVISEVTVENNVVRSKDQIWLLLGEVVDGYEPIIFKASKFQVNKAAHAACPVLRVTAYGAAAYARYYGRRLPTGEEWFYAYLKGAAQDENRADAMYDMMHGTANTNGTSQKGGQNPFMPSSVMLSKPNALGIRGMNEGIGEWGVREVKSDKGEKDKVVEDYVILGFAAGEKGAVSRQPWEAFERVGFRCVLDISGSQGRS
jgi:serine/threonine protein kinase